MWTKLISNDTRKTIIEGKITNIEHNCSQWKYTSAKQQVVKEHELSAHARNYNKFKCSQCKREFKNQPELNDHKKKHMKEPRLQCEICDFTTPNGEIMPYNRVKQNTWILLWVIRLWMRHVEIS